VRARPVRAVVDSNLLVRGLLRRRQGSAAVRLLDAAVDGAFQLVLSPYLLGEVRDTLREPQVRALRELTDAQIDAFIGALAGVSHVVEGAYAVDLVSRDPDDNPVVACALEAGARFVVTDDRKHLLPIKAVRVAGHRTVQIVGPAEFLRLQLLAARGKRP
jgi:putative PIN family toxin of toxin-antitoxin system